MRIACSAARVLSVHVAGYGKKEREKRGRLFTAREIGTKLEPSEIKRETAGRNLKGKTERQNCCKLNIMK
jgi:hypothetical protein